MRVFRSVQPEPSSPLDLAYFGVTTTAYQSPGFGYPKSPIPYNERQLRGYTTPNTKLLNSAHRYHQSTPWVVPTQRAQTSDCYTSSNFSLNERFDCQFDTPLYLPTVQHIPDGGNVGRWNIEAIVSPTYWHPSVSACRIPSSFSPPDSSSNGDFPEILSYEKMLFDSVKHLQNISESRNREFHGATINEIISDIAGKHGHTLPARYRECACVSLKRAFKKGIFLRKFGGVYSINTQYNGNIAKGRRKVIRGSGQVCSYSFHYHSKNRSNLL